ncbi:ruvb-like protein 1 [Nicotiana attenuata]|uniref:Ruvb-like protein 1 n=1 Tax=Nicotiana attenuata TaxID=49451 RepID=A0A1J6KLC8_NICAT|nr:ruvb-like protein 1 [Nicotiana attenuata]
MEDQIFRTMDDSIKVAKDSWSKDIAAIRSLLHELVENLSISKPTPVEFRRFCGEDPELWISQAERYFEFYGTSENNKLLRASFYLDGEALEWFRWLFRNKQLSDWEHFVAKVRIRFGKQHLEFPESHVAAIKDYSTGIEAQVFDKMSHGCCCSKVFATERSKVKVVTNALESDLKNATQRRSRRLMKALTAIATHSSLTPRPCNPRDKTGYQIALSSQGSIMSNAIGRFTGIKFQIAGATQNILGQHHNSDLHICNWVDTRQEQIFTGLLSSVSRETAIEQKVQGVLEAFADGYSKQLRFRVIAHYYNTCEKLGSMPLLIQNREKHEIFTVRTDLTLFAHAQHPGEPHLFHGIVYFDYMGGDYKLQFQLGALFERKETRTAFLNPVLEVLPDGKHYIVSSFDLLPGLAEGRGNGMKRLNSLSNLVGKGIIFSVWDPEIGLQLLTLIISSCGILLHDQTHAIFVNAKQYKKSVGALAVHKNECFLVCEEIHKRVVRCWHSQKSVTLLQAFDPGGVHQETKLYLFQDSEDHNPTQLQFKGRYHAQQALPSRYLAKDIASIWHCDELLIVLSNGRGCTYDSVTPLSRSKLLSAPAVVIVETSENAWLTSAYLYPEKRDVRNYVRLEVIIEGRPYAGYFIVGSLDMLTGFAKSSVSDVGLAIEDAHTALATKFASDAREYVPFPKEEFHIKKEIVKDITLHYLDAASDQPQGEQDILSLMCQLMAPRRIKFDHFIPSIKRWRVLFSMAILSVRKLKFLERLLKLGIGKGAVHIEIRPIYLAISYASICTDAEVMSHYNSCDSICTDAAVKCQYIKLVDVALPSLLAVDNAKWMLLPLVLYSNLEGKVVFEAGGIVVNSVSHSVEDIFWNLEYYVWDPY